jgi:hypothetical protein
MRQTEQEILIEVYGCKDSKDLENYLGIEMLSECMILEAMRKFAAQEVEEQRENLLNQIKSWIEINKRNVQPMFEPLISTIDSFDIIEFLHVLHPLQPKPKK